MKTALQRIGVILIFVTGMLLAQPPQNRTDRMMERLKAKVTLTKDQETKIRAILEKNQEAMAKERDQHQGDWETMRTAMAKHRDEADQQIEKLLTKEQKKQYEEYKKERQEMMKNRSRGNNQ